MKLYWKSSSKSKTGFKLIFLHYPAPQVPDNPACPLEQIPRYLEKLDLWQLRTVYFSSIPSTSKSTKRTEQVCSVREPLKIWPQISFLSKSQGFGPKWTHSRFLARQPLVVMKLKHLIYIAQWYKFMCNCWSRTYLLFVIFSMPTQFLDL